MINHFTFNGTSTAQLGLIVSGVSIFGAGSRKVEKAGIPGRNGDLQIELGGFNNYTVRYTVSITKNFTTTAQQIREWLLESKGYCDLTDTYHPDEIRKACFNSDIEFTTSMLYKYGQASIQFDCLPERYLTTNTPITTTATADTTTDTTLSLSTVPTPINISLNGNTTQEGSSGKNKLPIEAYTGIPYNPSAGTTISPTAKATQWTSNGNGTFKMTLTSWEQASLITAPLTAGQYVARVTTVTAGMIIGIYVVNADGTSNRVSALKNGTTANEAFQVATTLTQGQYFAFYIAGGSGECTIKEPMVEAGSTATAYEPHISPTNPQPIHSVSGDNTVFVSGKNMWGGTKMVSDIKKALPSATADYDNNIITYGANTDGNINPNLTADITFKPTTDYTIILSVSSNSATASTNMYVLFTDGTIEYINKPQALASKQTFAFHPNRLNKSIQGIHKVWASGTSTFYADECGLFEGNIELKDFEVFGAQSYPLYLPVENLLNLTNSTLTSYGVIFAINDGIVTAKGTTTRGSYGETDAITNGLVLLGNYGNYANVAENNSIEVTEGSYTLSADIVNNGNTQGGLFIGVGVLGARPTTFYKLTSGSYTVTATSGQRIMLAIWYEGNASATNVDLTISNIQLEKGTNANHYTPYGTTPIELNKIGTYQDYIYKNGGKWYLHKEIQKIVPPTHGYNYSTGTSSNVRYFTLNPANSAIGGSTSINTDANYYGFSNRFICRTGVEIGHFYITNSGNGLLFVVDQAITTSAELQTWLASNPTEFIILMRTATNTEITDTTLINQLNNIEKAYSYNGTTNILQVSNDNGFMLEVVSLHGSTFNSNYKGEPIITVNATGLIYLNGEVMEVLSAPVTINCQTMQCYNGAVNMNNEVRVNDFPEIKIGANEVGSSMALTITPNNWRH